MDEKRLSAQETTLKVRASSIQPISMGGIITVYLALPPKFQGEERGRVRWAAAGVDGEIKIGMRASRRRRQDTGIKKIVGAEAKEGEGKNGSCIHSPKSNHVRWQWGVNPETATIDLDWRTALIVSKSVANPWCDPKIAVLAGKKRSKLDLPTAWIVGI
jgi:hypothetical protein